MRTTWLLKSIFVTLAVCSDPASIQTVNRDALKPYSLPFRDEDPRGRAQSVKLKQEGILYGPGPDQNITAYPAGPLGDPLWQKDAAALTAEQNPHFQLVGKDAGILLQTLQKTGGIQSLADFSKLYDQQWKNSMRDIVDSSFFANYTNDLFFSMERLTLNPFTVRRLKPYQRLPFKIDDAIARNISGMTAKELLGAGRLFYVDHTALSKLPRQQGRFAAACEAYFFIHPQTGDWLPLAIKTNEGADLVYTPADAPADWLFAKMLFGQNDVWDTPWRHFASTHLMIELPYLAAQRCMSDNHPVLAIYKRLMLNAFALRQFIQSKLYAPGQYVDQLFSFNGKTATEYTMHLYEQGENKFQANYFPQRFERDGLLNSPFGPPIKHFPFAEDGAKIHAALKSFMTTFVHSYYDHWTSIHQDHELTCWFREVKKAGSVDFPSGGHVMASTLVDILTHVGYINSVQHQAMNNNDVFISALLPLSPMAFYKPLPTKKGLTESELLAFLPNATQMVGQLSLAAAFSRPELVNSDRTLLKAFSDEGLLSKLNGKTRAAARKFEEAMEKLSREVSSRGFDSNGLCRGAPFLWRALDPKVALFTMSI